MYLLLLFFLFCLLPNGGNSNGNTRFLLIISGCVTIWSLYLPNQSNVGNGIINFDVFTPFYHCKSFMPKLNTYIHCTFLKRLSILVYDIPFLTSQIVLQDLNNNNVKIASCCVNRFFKTYWPHTESLRRNGA